MKKKRCKYSYQYFSADCRSPQTVFNAKPALYNSTLTPYNALYECEAAYTMIGDFNISCQANSEWTTEMFICSGKQRSKM